MKMLKNFKYFDYFLTFTSFHVSSEYAECDSSDIES